MVHTVPDGMAPGSDTANLSVLGYDPKIYYSGRSPLEALSIGVPMTDTDIALRCNIVTISEEEGVPYEEQTIIDHSSSEISTEDCGILLEAVRKELENDIFKFYLGTSYRHCTIWHNGSVVKLTPPHDVLGQKVGPNLPETESLREMMKKSYEILKNHPLNIERKKKDLTQPIHAGSGEQGPNLHFHLLKKNRQKGVMISAVDLLKGIAVGAGMDNIIVPGADGTLNTNYEGKANAAIKALTEDGYDLHISMLKHLTKWDIRAVWSER